MNEWIETELAENQMHDLRHTKRLAYLLERLSEQAVSSIPQACHGWAETLAAYRFLDNPRVGLTEILSGHQHATLERLQAQEVVLLVQDTTFLNYGTLQAKTGVGTVKERRRKEYLLHLTVAFTPQRVNLGVLGFRMWQRPQEPVAHERARKPIEEKESYRWLESYQLACEVQQRCPATLVVNVADREGDIQECFLEAMSRAAADRAEFIIRAKCNRRIATDQGQGYLWPEMQSTRPLGHLTVEVARQGERAHRQATLTVAIRRVSFTGARRRGGRLPPVEVNVVYAKERRAPKREKPIEWLLLTSLPVEDFPSACTVVHWYGGRWEIEVFFRVLKQGCQIEQLRLQTKPRLVNALAVYLIVAWRIHTITMLSRAYPAVSCEIVFEPQEWQTIYTMHYRRRPPQESPPLREIVRCLAQLGGFLARTGDGEPGVQTIWQGYQRLHDFLSALETYRGVNTP
jgi:IS4 transposase